MSIGIELGYVRLTRNGRPVWVRPEAVTAFHDCPTSGEVWWGRYEGTANDIFRALGSVRSERS
jgi:hypothetical protein